VKKSLPDLLVKNDYYLVPCIPIPDKLSHLYLSLEDGWLPVLTPSHIDRETAFKTDAQGRVVDVDEALHFHIDVRFIKSDLPVGGSVGVSAKLFALILELCDFDTPNDEIEDFVEWKRKKCYRVAVDDFESSNVPSMYEPAIIAEGMRMTDKDICPHQKTCLKGMSRLNDTVVCPAHGLKWDLLSGNLIPRKNRDFTIYAIVMTKGHKEVLETFNPHYAASFAKENIKVEVWIRLPLPVFVYFDRSVFEVDRNKYL
jgi:nitrite reductase/ring-hydroxylating ferredoxin subunit